MFSLKPRLAALGFALTLSTAPSHGQQIGYPYVGPPHNIVYWGGTTDVNCQGCNNEWNALLNSYYTDVIINFVMPDSNCNVDTTTTAWQYYVDQLHSAGKTVLIAFGGGTAPFSNYSACYNNGSIPSLAWQLATFVNNNHFDGVDIDFEDTSSFNASRSDGVRFYDGIQFLEQLTQNLYWNLSFPNNIITHAPQTPYWLQSYSNPNYSAAPYAYVYRDVGSYIAWFNNQFYNQGCINGVGPIDCSADQKFNDYAYIGTLTTYTVGVAPPPIMMVMGFPIGWCSTTDINGNCNGDGWIGWTDPYNGNDTSDLIKRLQQAYPNQFGGIMGWNFDQDFATQYYYGPNGWSYAVLGALAGNQTPWYADSLQTWNCLDSNGNADTCANSLSQFWSFQGNYIINQATVMCLDAGSPSLTYQCILPGGAQGGTQGDPYQNWEFLGTTAINGRNGVMIRNRWTNMCLDSGQTPAVFVCNGGPWQQWTGGNE